MAIGNAPWPIGVDHVGIHMRPSRETISMKYVAHVLNDETQRKFIQGELSFEAEMLPSLIIYLMQSESADIGKTIDFIFLFNFIFAYDLN